MSTTLVPPSYYVVKPKGQPARRYRTVADAAAAIVQLAPTLATVGVVTGSRRRSLTDAELRELGRRVRTCRLMGRHGERNERERATREL
jgi:hypothetical protein